MCLDIREKNGEKPWDKRTIRYKVMRKTGRKLTGYYRHRHVYSFKWQKARRVMSYSIFGRKSRNEDFTLSGFHVFTSIKAARVEWRAARVEWRASRYIEGLVIAQVKVRGFKRSGDFCGLRSETWSEMRVVKILK